MMEESEIREKILSNIDKPKDSLLEPSSLPPPPSSTPLDLRTKKRSMIKERLSPFEGSLSSGTIYRSASIPCITIPSYSCSSGSFSSFSDSPPPHDPSSSPLHPVWCRKHTQTRETKPLNPTEEYDDSEGSEVKHKEGVNNRWVGSNSGSPTQTLRQGDGRGTQHGNEGEKVKMEGGIPHCQMEGARGVGGRRGRAGGMILEFGSHSWTGNVPQEMTAEMGVGEGTSSAQSSVKCGRNQDLDKHIIGDEWRLVHHVRCLHQPLSHSLCQHKTAIGPSNDLKKKHHAEKEKEGHDDGGGRKECGWCNTNNDHQLMLHKEFDHLAQRDRFQGNKGNQLHPQAMKKSKKNPSPKTMILPHNQVPCNKRTSFQYEEETEQERGMRRGDPHQMASPKGWHEIEEAEGKHKESSVRGNHSEHLNEQRTCCNRSDSSSQPSSSSGTIVSGPVTPSFICTFAATATATADAAVAAPEAGDSNRESLTKPEPGKKKSWGHGMACVGRRTEQVTSQVTSQHFGPIDGIEVGTCWRFRVQVSECGMHGPLVAGIWGREDVGACSIVFSAMYPQDADLGDKIYFTGSGGKDSKEPCCRTGGHQVKDQELKRSNKALAMSCATPFNGLTGGNAGKQWKMGKPVRVLRSGNGRGSARKSEYLPSIGIRYDGIYRVVKYWPEDNAGFRVWRFLLQRDDPNNAAPWTKKGRDRMVSLGLDRIIHPERTSFESTKKRRKRIHRPSSSVAASKQVEQNEGPSSSSPTPSPSPFPSLCPHPTESREESTVRMAQTDSPITSIQGPLSSIILEDSRISFLHPTPTLRPTSVFNQPLDSSKRRSSTSSPSPSLPLSLPQLPLKKRKFSLSTLGLTCSHPPSPPSSPFIPPSSVPE